MHVEFLIEEPSAEAALRNLVPVVLPQGSTFAFHVFSGKPDLLKNLPRRLRAYRRWLPNDWKIVVLVDEDRQDCHSLKTQMEQAALGCGFATKSAPDHNQHFHVLTRIAIEELEAWFFGDASAVLRAYPKVSTKTLCKAKFQNADAIKGGTAEALEKLLRRAGYYAGGMPKIEVASRISAAMDPANNRSRSFQVFRAGLLALA